MLHAGSMIDLCLHAGSIIGPYLTTEVLGCEEEDHIQAYSCFHLSWVSPAVLLFLRRHLINWFCLAWDMTLHTSSISLVCAPHPQPIFAALTRMLCTKWVISHSFRDQFFPSIDIYSLGFTHFSVLVKW